VSLFQVPALSSPGLPPSHSHHTSLTDHRRQPTHQTWPKSWSSTVLLFPITQGLSFFSPPSSAPFTWGCRLYLFPRYVLSTAFPSTRQTESSLIRPESTRSCSTHYSIGDPPSKGKESHRTLGSSINQSTIRRELLLYGFNLYVAPPRRITHWAHPRTARARAHAHTTARRLVACRPPRGPGRAPSIALPQKQTRPPPSLAPTATTARKHCP